MDLEILPHPVCSFSSVQFSSLRTFILHRSNSLESHKCAVKSRPWVKRNSNVFSLRWNCPTVGVASRNDWGSELRSNMLAPTLQNCVVRRLTFWFTGQSNHLYAFYSFYSFFSFLLFLFYIPFIFYSCILFRPLYAFHIIKRLRLCLVGRDIEMCADWLIDWSLVLWQSNKMLKWIGVDLDKTQWLIRPFHVGWLGVVYAVAILSVSLVTVVYVKTAKSIVRRFHCLGETLS